MFDQYIDNYKKKNIAIIMVAVLFFSVAYILAFNKSFVLLKENKILSKQLLVLDSAPKELAENKIKLSSMNKNLGYVGSADEMSKEFILDFVSHYTDTSTVFLKSMPRTLVFDKNGYQLETNILELQGDFKQLTQLIYQIEYEYKISKIASVNYQLKTDLYTKRKDLILTLYLQNIIL